MYQFDDYKMYIKNKLFALPKKLWKKHLIEGKQQKSQFVVLLNRITSKERAEQFANDIYQILKGFHFRNTFS